jgi:hypothetical protein
MYWGNEKCIKILVEKPEEKILLQTPSRRGKDDFNTDIK